jgi:hypothetical protein
MGSPPRYASEQSTTRLWDPRSAQQDHREGRGTWSLPRTAVGGGGRARPWPARGRALGVGGEPRREAEEAPSLRRAPGRPACPGMNGRFNLARSAPAANDAAGNNGQVCACRRLTQGFSRAAWCRRCARGSLPPPPSSTPPSFPLPAARHPLGCGGDSGFR